MTCTVSLVNCPDASPDVIHAAESGFRTALQDALGDRIDQCLRAFINARELGVAHLRREEIIDAAQWMDAFENATIAGCRHLGDIGKAYFDVRLAEE